MTPPRARALLQRKLAALVSYLDELAATVPPNEAAYSADSTVRRAVERLVQVVVEAATDSGDLLLASEGRTVGESTREIFEGLHAAGAIDDGLRRRFAYEHSALRNRIMHNYDELDNAAVWRAGRQLVPDGRALAPALTARLAAGPLSPELISSPLDLLRVAAAQLRHLAGLWQKEAGERPSAWRTDLRRSLAGSDPL